MFKVMGGVRASVIFKVMGGVRDVSLVQGDRRWLWEG